MSSSRTGTLAMAALPVAVILVGLGALGLIGGDKPDMEVLKIDFKKQAGRCVMEFTADEKEVKKSDQHVLTVRIKNDCDGEERLRIIPKPLVPGTDLPLRCTGQPVDANIGAEFGIAKKSKAYVICGVEYKGDIHTFALRRTLAVPPPPPSPTAGPSANPTDAPSTGLVAAVRRGRASEIALEEVP